MARGGDIPASLSVATGLTAGIVVLNWFEDLRARAAQRPR